MWTVIRRVIAILLVGWAFVATSSGAMRNLFLQRPTIWGATILALAISAVIFTLSHDPLLRRSLNTCLRSRLPKLEALSLLLSVSPFVWLTLYALTEASMVSNSSKVFLGLAGMLLCGAAVCFYIGYSRIDFSESTASPKKQAPAKADSIVNLETEEPPMVKQKSIEANSPNVVGNNNQIVYNQAPVQVVPPPENVRWTSQWIPSPDPRYMVCLEVTVQVDATISPFAIGFICNKPIKNADAAIRSGAMMDSFESGRLNTAPPEHSFYFRFHSPPISPQHPMVVTLFADEQFNLEQVGRLKK